MISVFDHPWQGGLFADPDLQATWGADRQIAHFLAFETALAHALERTGRVEAGLGRAVAQALADFAPDYAALREAMGSDGVPIPELVRQMRVAVGPAASALHSGATSQDVMDTALALTLRDVTDILLPRLSELRECLAAMCARFGDSKLMGRTRMQAALPITAPARLSPVLAGLGSQENRLRSLRPDVERLQLGGAVGTNHVLGDDAQTVAGFVAEELGLSVAKHVWHADRSAIVDYGNVLALISGTLGKFGQDIALMAQQGIDDMQLSGGGGSSAMPHKSNPVKAELLVTLARFNAGQAGLMHQAMIHEQERSGAAWMLEWMVLPQITSATGRGLSAALALCGEIQAIGQE